MTRAFLLCAAAAAALSLGACNKASNTASNAADSASNTASAAGNTMSSANPGQSGPVNKAQDAAGSAVGAMSASTLGSHDTGAFVSNVVQGNMYEVQAAQLAEQKSKNTGVKDFAKQMVKDHTAMANELKPLITAAGQTPPADLDQRRKGFLDNLKAADPASFDKTYVDQQVAAHEETLSLLQGYAKDGSDAGLKGAAAKATPKVQSHLDMAKKLQASEGAGK